MVTFLRYERAESMINDVSCVLFYAVLQLGLINIYIQPAKRKTDLNT